MRIRVELTKKGIRRWVLDYMLAGERKRNYFKSEDEAAQMKRELKIDILDKGAEIARLPAVTRAELILAQSIAEQGGFSVIESVNWYNDYVKRKPLAEGLGEAIDIFLEQRKKEITTVSYKNLKSVMLRFKGAMTVDKVVQLDQHMIKDWANSLTQKKSDRPARSRTKNGYLGEVRNFLNWAKINNIVTENEAGKVAKFKKSMDELKVDESKKQILTPSDVRKVMDWVVKNRPDMTPRVAALFFAGLRPDREAREFRWHHIDFEENLLFVPASNAKDRQRRYIEMHPTLVKWMNWSKDQDLPVKNWENGWWRGATKATKEWPHDAARHCYASYSIPVIGKEKTIEHLGHGDFEMLFKHYRTVVKRSHAEDYWDILPPR